MSNGNRNTVIVVAVASMFCFGCACAVAIAWAVPDGANAGALIAQLFAALGLTIPAVVGLSKLVSRQENVVQGVEKLRNGEMEAKVRKALVQVLQPHLVDPDVEPQLERDRAAARATDEETR